MHPLHGIITALITPLNAAGRLDEAAVERLVERQCAAGIQALFILGSVGEGPLLPDEEYARMARAAGRAVAGRVPLLCGVSDTSVPRVQARLAVAAAAGATHAVATLPYYGCPDPERTGLAFFEALAKHSPLPLLPYNLPMNIHWDMTGAFIERLYAIPNLAGLKDTRNAPEAMAALAGAPHRPPGFAYLPGNTLLGARLIRAGADGLVCTPANVLPELFVALHGALRAADGVRADWIEGLVQRLCQILAMPTGIAAIKSALASLGLCGATATRPLPDASPEQAAAIAAIVAEVQAALAAGPPAGYLS